MFVSSSPRSGSDRGSGAGSTGPNAGARRRPRSLRAAPDRLEFKLSAEGAGGEPASTVLVVFAEHAGCPWLRLLRRGFRHCFVVLRAGSVWLACEPLKDRIELDALELPCGFDLAAFYHEQGHRVLLGRRPPAGPRRRFALAPLTCVTVVKRLLAIDAPRVWTPWQLYNHLSGPEVGFRPWPEPLDCVTSQRRRGGGDAALDILRV
jgi:hypothetical protein